MAEPDLKPGDKIIGRFQNLNIQFTVTTIDTNGPYVWVRHDAGEIHVRKQDIEKGSPVRKQDIKERLFDLEVKPRT